MRTEFLNKIVRSAIEGHFVEIPYILFLIHRVRTGFDEQMNLDDPRKRAMYLYWWLAHGRSEYNFYSDFISDFNRKALSSVHGVQIGPLSWSLLADLGFEFDGYTEGTETPKPNFQNDKTASLKWFYTALVPKRDLFAMLNQDEINYLTEKILFSSDPSDWLDRLMMFSRELDGELTRKFEIETPQGRAIYRQWFEQVGKKRDNISAYYLSRENIERQTQFIPVQARGVNIIGLAGSVSGVGEDARMASMSLGAAGIQHVVAGYNRPGDVANCIYNVNLFCITGYQLMLTIATLGPDVMRDRYNIGFFPWELPEWPEDLRPALDVCDELWVASQFIYDSIRPFTDRPVKLMPMAVETPKDILDYAKSHKRAPESPVRFIFIYDFQSGSERKNIWKCIEAFQRAFSGDESVELVIKTINHDLAKADHQALESIIAGDSRIQHIKGVLNRSEVLKLICDSDVFLSLHRAEGFGRGIAESLLLGKQVVTTNYSGNLEFSKPDNSFLVDYDLVPVKSNHYVFSHGQVWAEIRLDSAASKIRECYARIRAGEAFNANGQNFLRSRFSASHVGDMYSQRLRELKLI